MDDLERLSSMTRFDIGYYVNSDYHLNVAKALCRRAIGQKEKAIEIIEKQYLGNAYRYSLSTSIFF
jgi:hypothetical protein